jgi:hypothetical protein
MLDAECSVSHHPEVCLAVIIVYRLRTSILPFHIKKYDWFRGLVGYDISLTSLTPPKRSPVRARAESPLSLFAPSYHKHVSASVPFYSNFIDSLKFGKVAVTGMHQGSGRLSRARVANLEMV